MSSFRDRPSLSERLRGKSTEEIIKEMRDSMDKSKKKFFDEGRSSFSPSASSRRFGFDDESHKDLDFHLERLAEEHPEIAEPLRSWRLDKASKKKRRNPESWPGSDTCSTSSATTTPQPNNTTSAEFDPQLNQQDCQGREKKGLETDSKFRYTVPDMRREQEDDADRVGRSQSAPPSQQANDSQQHTPQAREPVVRHIPIFVEGRDEPVIPKDFVDSPFPREKRNLSRETSPVPPVRRAPHEGAAEVRHEGPVAPPRHTSSVHINHSEPVHHRHSSDRPVEIKINHDAGPAKPPTAQQQQPPKQPTPAKSVPQGPLEKVNAVQQQVGSMMEKVEQFSGNSRQDKEYMFLDEMLTRNLLQLDNIETDGKEDVRAARKEAIRQIQRCISVLESKAPVGGNSATSQTDTTTSAEGQSKSSKEENGSRTDVAADDSQPSLGSNHIKTVDSDESQKQPQESSKGSS